MHAILGIVCVWLVSRLLGELARWVRQPAIIGELCAGIVLGPSLIGHYFNPTSPLLDTVGLVGTALFLLTAGWEIRLSEVRRYRYVGLAVSIAGAVVPFGIGFGLGRGVPGLMGYDGLTPLPVFAWFLGIALSVSALPVIARTLMDMGLYRSRVGIVTMSAVTIDDLLGWIGFSMVLGFTGQLGAGAQFRFFLPLGCYIAGVLIGETGEARAARTKAGVNRVVREFFAPIVFGSTALKLSFIANFDIGLVLCLVTAASAGKILGCAMAAMAMRLPQRESWAVGFAMNSRGAMMIILAFLAWQLHVIGDRLLVGLVTMAVVTSLLSAPLIRRVLAGTQPEAG